MSKLAREPLLSEEERDAEAQPETASALGIRPPGRVGSGLRHDANGGEHEPPSSGSGSSWSGEADAEVVIDRGIGAGAKIPIRQYIAPIEDLRLSMRGYNCLRRSGLVTLGQVIEKTREELLSLRNFGGSSYVELRERLDQLEIRPLERGVN